MKVSWHCATCNESGSCNISIHDLVKEKPKNIISASISYIKKNKHSCIEQAIVGIRAISADSEETKK